METTITPEDVAVELGMGELDQATSDRFVSWIARAERMIRRRAGSLGVEWSVVDPDAVDDVILMAVAQYARNPEGAEYYDVSVDDAREMRRFQSPQTALTILDEWWALLFPSVTSGAFSTQMFGQPDRACAGLDWS